MAEEFVRHGSKCDHCEHGPLSHYCWWNRFVANPIKKFGPTGKGFSAMILLKREIMDRILLRRTKVQEADVLALPPRTVGTLHFFFFLRKIVNGGSHVSD